MIGRDGGIGFEERFWSAYSAPAFGPCGALLSFAHTTKDVTEQIRSEHALRESENRFRALSTAGQVVWRTSADRTELRELDGRARSDPQRRRVRTGSRVRRIDGSDGWTLSRALPIRDAGGRVVEWIGASSDITERKVTEQKLREPDRRKTSSWRCWRTGCAIRSQRSAPRPPSCSA